jgi:hypothetical protein
MNRVIVRSTVAAGALLVATAAVGQQTSAAGPVPAAIISAKTIFISNGGSDAGLFPSPFSGDESRPYDEFYKALQGDTHYQLVSDPAQADLVLELRLLAPYGPTNANKSEGAANPQPQFRLKVYERTTHYVLWTLTQSIPMAILQKTHDRNFDEAITHLVGAFEELGQGKPAA